MSRAVNYTFITLVSKKIIANKVDQFQTTALCNVIYKVIIAPHDSHQPPWRIKKYLIVSFFSMR